MVDLAKLKAANLARWSAASVTPSLIPTVDAVSHRLAAAKARYQTVEAKTGVPWAVIAVIHERESSQAGPPRWPRAIPGINRRSTFRLVVARSPHGRLPPRTRWRSVRRMPRSGPTGPSAARSACSSNKTASATRRGIPSPYVWATTNQYHRGKYIADGHFDPTRLTISLDVRRCWLGCR